MEQEDGTYTAAFTVSTENVVSASFTLLPSVTVTTDAGVGVVTLTGDKTYTATSAATADGYAAVFAGVKAGTYTVSATLTDSSYKDLTITVDGVTGDSVTVGDSTPAIVIGTTRVYSITVSEVTGATIAITSPAEYTSGTASLDAGTAITFTFSSTVATITDVSVIYGDYDEDVTDLSYNAETDVYSFTMPAGDVTIKPIVMAETGYIGSSSSTVQTFDSYTLSTGDDEGKWTSSGTIKDGDISTNTGVGIATGYGIYGNGNALLTRNRGSGSASTSTYTLTNAITNGTVVFIADVGTDYYHDSYTYSAYQGGSIILSNSDGDAVLTISIPAYNKTAITATGSGDAVSHSSYTYASAAYYRNSSGGDGKANGFHIEITLDLDNSVADVVLEHENSSDTDATVVSYTLSDIDIDGANIASLSVINTNGVSKCNVTTELDNVQFYSLANAGVATYDYTINYQLDGTTVATETSSTTAGTEVSAKTQITGTEEGCTDTVYYITDETAPTLKVSNKSANNVLNVPVRAENTYTVTVNAVDSATQEVVETLAATTVKESSPTFTYSYSAYLTDSNNKVTYSCDNTSYTATEMITESKTITVPYTAYTGTAYFVEHEALDSTTTLAASTFSGGTASRANDTGVAAFTIGEAGTYTLTSASACRNVSNNTVYALYNGAYNSTDTSNLIASYDAKGYSQNGPLESITPAVSLAANDVVYVQGDSGNTYVDYVLAVKVDVEVYTATVNVEDSSDSSALSGATVKIVGSTDSLTYAQLTTGTDGACTTLLPEGTYTVTVALDGYTADSTGTLTVTTDGTGSASITMTAEATAGETE